MGRRKDCLPNELGLRGDRAEEARLAVHEAWRQRNASPEASAQWLARIAEFRAVVTRAYPAGFWEAFDRLPTGDADAIEMATLFLEADPWFDRSGYVKAELIRRLKRLPLPSDIQERLRAVVLEVARMRDRREYRA